jgi:thiamine-phosphate pyrophosphorylase
MMADFTPAVARAMELARSQACIRGEKEVQPADLLQALLAEEDGRAAALLACAGADLSGFRRANQSSSSNTPAHPANEVVLSRASQQTLFKARELAIETGADRIVGSAELLWAILSEEETLLADLCRHGLDPVRLDKAFAQMRVGPLPLDEPLDLETGTDVIARERILDASANRSREALRVVEDYCRFVLDDAFLTGQLKALRHELAGALGGGSDALLLEARETIRDVGTSLEAPGQHERADLIAVARVNFKRLQESLRSLEEFGKLREPELGKAIEKIRYRTYTLERATLLGALARERLAGMRLQVLVTANECSASLDWTIHEAIAGGAQIIQLREKTLGDRALLELARQVRKWTRQLGALFIINDRPDLGRLIEADGVHLGQEDLPVKEARRILGPDALIGVSTHSIEQARQAVLDGASYIGVGATFPSATKAFSDFPGLELVRQVALETTLPAFAIGGVNLANVSMVREAGGRRLAVAQAICQAADPRRATSDLLHAIEG